MNTTIKRIAIKILSVFLNLIYCLFKIRKTNPQKVVMASRQSDSPSVDFFLLKNEFERQGFEVFIYCRQIKSGVKGAFCYFLHILKVTLSLSNASCCIVDTYCIPVSLLRHKDSLKIAQVWHALGAVKKFGYQILDQPEGRSSVLAKALKMHENYTFVTCASEATKKIYKESFGVADESIKVVGMPRVDYLLNLENSYNKDIHKDYPQFKAKKNIVYVPTFRKNTEIAYQDFVAAFDQDEFNLVVRLHPLDKALVDEQYLVDSKYDVYDLLYVADYVVTDYSAISIEAAILNKPVYWYLYDCDLYDQKRGLNIDLFSEVGSAVCLTAAEVKNKICDEYDYETLRGFKRKYVETLDQNNTQQVVRTLMNSC